jgi:periplasmic divalent cation tolerance protein
MLSAATIRFTAGKPQVAFTGTAMREAVHIITTTDSRAVAEQIARQLIECRLAACVQVGGPVTSTYRWQGKIECAEEWVCTVKTTRDRYQAVESCIRAHHTYQEPEIILVPMAGGSTSYLAWLEQQVALPPTDA